MFHKTVQGGACTGEARHHSADRHTKNLRNHAVLQPFNAYQQHDLSMIIGQTPKRVYDFLPFKMRDLSGFLKCFRSGCFRQRNETPQTPPVTHIEAMRDCKQPRSQIRLTTHLMQPPQGAFQTILHKVVCLRRITGQNPRIPHQRRNSALQPDVCVITQTRLCLLLSQHLTDKDVLKASLFPTKRRNDKIFSKIPLSWE